MRENGKGLEIINSAFEKMGKMIKDRDEKKRIDFLDKIKEEEIQREDLLKKEKLFYSKKKLLYEMILEWRNDFIQTNEFRKLFEMSDNYVIFRRDGWDVKFLFLKKKEDGRILD